MYSLQKDVLGRSVLLLGICLSIPHHGEAASPYNPPSMQTCQEIQGIFQKSLDIANFFNTLPAEKRGEGEEFQKWRKMEEDFQLKYPDFIVPSSGKPPQSPEGRRYFIDVKRDQVLDKVDIICGHGKIPICDLSVSLDSKKKTYEERFSGRNLLIRYKNRYYLAFSYSFRQGEKIPSPQGRIVSQESELVYISASEMTQNGLFEACQNPDVHAKDI